MTFFGGALQVLEVRRRDVVFQVVPGQVRVHNAVGSGDGRLAVGGPMVNLLPAMMGRAACFVVLAFP